MSVIPGQGERTRYPSRAPCGRQRVHPSTAVEELPCLDRSPD